MECHVEPRSLLFTDGHKAYGILKQAGYIHGSGNHKAREFSRPEMIYGVEVVVTTNSAEGMFGQCKEFTRAKG
eukprot:11401055-Karenia_brevis.AAC.1